MSAKCFVLLLACVLCWLDGCNGHSVLYVHPEGNDTDCPSTSDPASCRLLSEYAVDMPNPLESNTSFVFLPGLHVLNTTFNVADTVTDLSLRPLETGLSTSITCEIGGKFSFGDGSIEFLEILSLEFNSCRTTDYDFSSFILIYGVSDATVKDCKFTNNTISILESRRSAVHVTGCSMTLNTGLWWIALFDSTATLIDNTFANNTKVQVDDGLGIFMISSHATTNGTNVFYRNTVGTIGAANSTLVLDGSVNFTCNVGTVATILTTSSSVLSFVGRVYFEENLGYLGGVCYISNGWCTVSGELMLIRNNATNGGAFYFISSSATFMSESNVTFIGNKADENGGAIFLSGGSKLNFFNDTSGSVIFKENSATSRGGAIYVLDTNPLAYCLRNNYQDPISVEECFFDVVNYECDLSYSKRMHFIGNTAGNSGSAIYGGVVDMCFLRADDRTDNLPGRQLFDQIVAGIDDNRAKNGAISSVISSEPYIVCVCTNNEPTCENTSLARAAYPGASIEVTVIAFGQRNGAVPATIESIGINLAIEELEINQGIPSQCSNLSYTVYAQPGYAFLQLYAEGPCRTQGEGLNIEVEVLDCPPGFVTGDDRHICTCDPRLTRYTDTCDPQDGTIVRDDDFWVGYDRELDGLILYPTCPFDYCITDQISLRVEDSDAQCDNNRAGLLCGECSEGLSLLLGSSKCEKCSNDYLALLLFFAAAGLMLVALLLLLNLTVAVGTINGLIFYANIVAVNLTVFFPSSPNTYLDILKVIIAWINLDFGIESCFFDRMDAYAQTWLQYVFPVYIWLLIGLVFIVSHFSSRASKYLGSNPVAVLATLILLSYTKVLSTIIEAFSSASLDYPEGESRLVWLYDGNIPFLDADDGRHLGLFVASLLILLLLFIPYTLLLLTSQWLQIKSDWKVLSWLNKHQLRAFLDAYHAPYKPRHRYWPGLLLLVRLAMLVTSALNVSTDPSVIPLVILIFVLFILVWTCVVGGLYKKWYLNVLDAFFYLNLGLLAASVEHVFATEELSSSETQSSITATLVTASLLAFTGIIAFHVFLRLKNTNQLKKVITMMTRPEVKEQELALAGIKQDPQVTTTSVSLREPLLLDEN